MYVRSEISATRRQRLYRREQRADTAHRLAHGLLWLSSARLRGNQNPRLQSVSRPMARNTRTVPVKASWASVACRKRTRRRVRRRVRERRVSARKRGLLQTCRRIRTPAVHHRRGIKADGFVLWAVSSRTVVPQPRVHVQALLQRTWHFWRCGLIFQFGPRRKIPPVW